MIGDNLKRRRLKLGLTLNQVGEMVGVTRSTIQRYESGEIGTIDTKMIMKLSEALGTTPAQLCGWEKIPLTGNDKLDEIFSICVQMDDDQLQTVLELVKVYKKSFNTH